MFLDEATHIHHVGVALAAVVTAEVVGSIDGPGDVITPLYDSYDYTNESFYASGTPFSYIGDNSLVFGALPEGEYLYSFWIDDIYGGAWMSDTVSFTIQNGSVMYNLAA